MVDGYLPACVSVYHTLAWYPRRPDVIRSCSYGWLQGTVWVLGIGSGSSEKHRQCF